MSIWVNVLKVDSVFHLVLLRCRGLYEEHPETLLYKDVNASVLKAEEEL